MREVKLSSADRELWPGEGITKGDLLEYYRAVAPAIVPHLRNRPFTMKRYREGIAKPFFFQKDAPKGMPDWIPTRHVPDVARARGSRGSSTSRSSTTSSRCSGWCRCTAST